jgi:hypothetical protein
MSAINRFDVDAAIPTGKFNPEIREAFTVAPEVVYSPILLSPEKVIVTNRFVPDTAMHCGKLNPEISAAFTVAPEVVYSPIVPMPLFSTKICPRAVAGMAHSANSKEAVQIDNVVAVRIVTLGTTDSLGWIFKMRPGE